MFLSLPLFSANAQEKKPSLDVTVHDGFEVELVRSAGEGEGSWISLAFDDKGRIILGRDATGVARITPATDERPQSFEVLDDTLRHCRGVLFAFDSIYVCATDSKGFYRLRDKDADGSFETVELLKEMDYRSRYGHGTNQVLLGPDNMIYVVNGNDVSFPEGFDSESPYRNPHNDKLLPNPHDAGEDDRVGHILRIDPDGKTWTVVAGGFRNQFDAAFNAEGELFTYDADMEWDAGLPWYRPTRLNHVVSGGEYGWRWGTAKWPTYYLDSLPTNLDTGYGSPTGIVFGTQSRFPERYRNALFMGDWQNGRIYLADLIPDGSSYRAIHELFLAGGPLNVCDIEFGPDGHMYFVTGGRGSQSGLYRVKWTGKAEPPALPEEIRKLNPQYLAQCQLLRAQRRQLEQFHTVKDPVAVDAAWHALASDDRWLQFAARVALENQDVSLWRRRALEEATPRGSAAALLALARVGAADDLPEILQAVLRQPPASLDVDELLGFLRVSAVAMARHGQPHVELARRLAEQLAPFYPHADTRVNRELSELLISLGDPEILSKTLDLLSKTTAQEEQIHLAMTLRHVRGEWSPEQRRQFFRWLGQARTFSGGKLVKQAVLDMKADFLASLSESEQAEFAEEIAALEKPLESDTPEVSLPIVKTWTFDELQVLLDQVTRERSRTTAEQALAKASCLKCHRIGATGGQVGPDLTTVGGRFDTKALLESIVEPSKVIDPKYRFSSYVLDNGKVVTGRPIGVNAKQITIELDPIKETSLAIDRATIEEVVPSSLSPMPVGLINYLTEEEILDLLALLKYGR